MELGYTKPRFNREWRLKLFMRKIEVQPLSGCMVWTGAKRGGGYGATSLNEKLISAHRAAWLLSGRPDPGAADLDHLCRNRACCNPDHLEIVTRSVNLLRGHEATGCRNGHPYSEDTRQRIYLVKQGRWKRRCMLCEKEANKRRWARQKKASQT